MSARRIADGPFGPRVLVALAVIATLSFAAALIAGGLGSTFAPRSAGADSYSYSAVGHRALLAFLEARGTGALARRDPREAAPDEYRPLALLEPPKWPQELADEAIQNDAALVVALPKREVMADPAHEGWIAHANPVDMGILAPLLQPRPYTKERLKISYFEGGRERRCQTRAGHDVRVLLGEPAQLFTELPAGFEAVVSCPDGALVAVSADEDRSLYLIADPDLFNNQGLAKADHAAIVAELIDDELGASGLIVDETIHGYGTRFSLIAELLSFPLSLATAAVIALLGVALWAGMRRFGRPHPATERLELGKQVLIDNTARLMRLSPHAGPFLERFATEAVADVAAHVAQPLTQDEGALLATLHRIGAAHGIATDPAELLARLRNAARQPKLTHDEAARLAQDIHAWRREMIDGTRGHS